MASPRGDHVQLPPHPGEGTADESMVDLDLWGRIAYINGAKLAIELAQSFPVAAHGGEAPVGYPAFCAVEARDIVAGAGLLPGPPRPKTGGQLLERLVGALNHPDHRKRRQTVGLVSLGTVGRSRWASPVGTPPWP